MDASPEEEAPLHLHFRLKIVQDDSSAITVLLPEWVEATLVHKIAPKRRGYKSCTLWALLKHGEGIAYFRKQVEVHS